MGQVVQAEAWWDNETPEIQVFYAVVHQTGPTRFCIYLPDLDDYTINIDREEDIISVARQALLETTMKRQLNDPLSLQDIERKARRDLAAGSYIVAVSTRAVWN